MLEALSHPLRALCTIRCTVDCIHAATLHCPDTSRSPVKDFTRKSVVELANDNVQEGQFGKFTLNEDDLLPMSAVMKFNHEPKKGTNLSSVVAEQNGYNNRAYDVEDSDGTDSISKKPSESVPPIPEKDPETTKSMKLGIMKNIIMISVAFTFLFTAYNAMANLQSSINEDLGTTSLAVLYGALVVSCAFVPPLLISKLKVKHTIAFCMLGYSAYMLAQFYPEYYTMIPGAILLGLGAAPMWSAKCTYLTEVGRIYAELTNQDTEVVVTRMFGIFFLFFQSTQVWGNLISSSVLSVDSEVVDPDDPAVQLCGINYCPWDNHTYNSTQNEVTDAKRYTLSGIYLGCALLSSVIILLFVDPLSRFGDYESRKETATMQDGVKLLGATFRHLTHPYQLLIVPLTIWSGVEQAFIQGDFTNAFVSCGLGVHMVGYVMICYGLCDALCSVCFSPMVKLVGRVPVFVLGVTANVSMIILFFIWQPNSDEMYVFFIAAAVWGIADAVWQTQINAFYGVIFPGEAEAAFSNYRMWESVGFIITFVTNSTICIDSKLYIVIGFLSVGMLGYFTIELLEKYRVLPRGPDDKVLRLYDH
ncbi:Ion channel regulatory protein UNC-93 [Trinorchestia longiramus]|nr:Ion channel regulatory protein UNC-93 [Trinorchestia longiramus]